MPKNNLKEKPMKPKYMTIKENILYFIWRLCGILTKPFYIVGNWAGDKLNKSYYHL